MYHFLSGYTARMAGTEKGLGSEPQTTFSSCFGAPFLPLPPRVYAELLGSKLKQHQSQVWLVNTGWTGGQYGVGHRIDLPYTRALVRAAMQGELNNVPMRLDPNFGFEVPEQCPEVPCELLDPRQAWIQTGVGGDTYDQKAQLLAVKFTENFAQFKGSVSVEVMNSGPQ